MTWPDRLQLRPITTWPTNRTAEPDRKVAPFRAPLSTTLIELDRELRNINASDVFMEIAIPDHPEMWRLDGRPRAGARPDHPGVIIAFRSRVAPGREVRVATDRFVSWQDNLRAIVKTLEHQRAFERYGTATRGEQYSGFAQLGAGGADAARGEMLARQHGSLVKAMRALHPDLHPDDPIKGSDWQDLMAYKSRVDAQAAAA